MKDLEEPLLLLLQVEHSLIMRTVVSEQESANWKADGQLFSKTRTDSAELPT